MIEVVLLAIAVIITILGILLINNGLGEGKTKKVTIGFLMIIINMTMMLIMTNMKNNKDMKSAYKFKRLNEMKLDDYGFGLFEYNSALYFKEADEGKCFDVRSGNEVIIGKDKIIMTLED